VNAPYILAGWIVVFVTLAVYASLTIARGRRLARRVPPAQRRWIDSDEAGAP
jgi:hypothetical protein